MSLISNNMCTHVTYIAEVPCACAYTSLTYIEVPVRNVVSKESHSSTRYYDTRIFPHM